MHLSRAARNSGAMTERGTQTGPKEKLGYALLLSVPPGIGVTGFVATRTAQGDLTLFSLGAGFLTTLVIFLVVVLIAFTGPDEEADPPHET